MTTWLSKVKTYNPVPDCKNIQIKDHLGSPRVCFILGGGGGNFLHISSFLCGIVFFVLLVFVLCSVMVVTRVSELSINVWHFGLL